MNADNDTSNKELFELLKGIDRHIIGLYEVLHETKFTCSRVPIQTAGLVISLLAIAISVVKLLKK